MMTFPLRIRTMAVCRVDPSDFFLDLKVAMEIWRRQGNSEGHLVSSLFPPQTVNYRKWPSTTQKSLEHETL